jgi:predicted RNA binding protein YcfA (HicA-like mRNA interferase family)
MPKLPRVKASEVISALEKLGFVQVRQKGSHVILKRKIVVQEGKTTREVEVGCVVPMHRKTLAVGTLSSILNQASITIEELMENL